MKRSTIILLIAAAALAAVTFLVTSRTPEGPPPGLTIDGYATAADLAAEKNLGLLEGPLEIAHEIDEITLDRPSGFVRIVRDGEGADAVWRLTEPVSATAVKYQVEKIIGLFKTDTVSVFSTRLSQDDVALYDLEPDRRVGLTLKSKGEVYRGVDLYIGRTEKGDGPEAGGEAEVDTWVMTVANTTIVHRITGKDLRTPALEPLDGLRDKKVFAFKTEDLTEVAVTTPDGRRVVLTGLRTELEPPAQDGGEDGGEPAEPEVVVSWKLSEPDGVMPDTSAQNLPRSLANLRAKEFVPADDAPEDALSGPVWRVEAKVHEGEGITLTIADRGADGAGDEIWARLEGTDELMKLNAHSANQLRKTVEDLRDKKALDLDRASVTGLILAGADGPIALAREGDTWSFTTPTVRFPADPSTVLGSVTRITVARWARADELEAARAALASPAVRGAVIAGDAVHEVAFSEKLESADNSELEGKRWGVVGDPASAEPFLVPDFAATRFQTTVDALRSKKILGERGRDAVRAVEITQPGGGEPIRLEASAGGGAPKLADLPEGGAADDGQLQTLFATATGLTAKAFVDGRDRADLGLNEPALRVALSLGDGTTLTVLISAQDDGTDPYATVEGGPLDGSLFTLNTYQVKNLQKPRAELLQ